MTSSDAAREPRTPTSIRPPWTGTTNGRKSVSLGLAAYRPPFVLLSAEPPSFTTVRGSHAVFGRGALERYALAHARNDVRDVLDRELRAARQLVELRERLGHPRALTAAVAFWYLGHSSTAREGPRLAGLGPYPLAVREVVRLTGLTQLHVVDDASACEVRLRLSELLIAAGIRTETELFGFAIGDLDLEQPSGLGLQSRDPART